MKFSQRSWSELSKGIASADIWFNLAVVDIIQRYRRTLLGPVWHVFSHAATILGLSLLYSRVLNQDGHSYLLYVAAGLTVWSLIVQPFVDGPTILTRAKQLIYAYDMPLSIHIMRAVSGYFLVFLHNMTVYIVVLVFVGAPLNLYSLWFFPAVAVILVASVGLSMIVSVFGARFRDLGPATAMLTSIAFLLTPVFWNKTQAMGIGWITNWNPFFHFIEIARSPLLGQAPNLTSWVVSLAIAAFMMVAGAASMVINRSNITYWV